jgi:16S rRNA (guanine527-N7)-methyltransferase
METSKEHRSGLDWAGLGPKAVEQLEAFLALLLKWNARMNLTAARTPEEIVRRHFAESIFAARLIPKKVKTLVDFGSGAGFPGIPIAIARPEIGVTLAESQGKKAAFLLEAVRMLGLKAEVWPKRVEDMEAGRVFDAATLRAVDKMAEACDTAVKRLAPGGWIAVFATRKTEESLEKLKGIRWGTAVTIPGSKQEILKTGDRL